MLFDHSEAEVRSRENPIPGSGDTASFDDVLEVEVIGNKEQEFCGEMGADVEIHFDLGELGLELTDFPVRKNRDEIV